MNHQWAKDLFAPLHGQARATDNFAGVDRQQLGRHDRSAGVQRVQHIGVRHAHGDLECFRKPRRARSPIALPPRRWPWQRRWSQCRGKLHAQQPIRILIVQPQCVFEVLQRIAIIANSVLRFAQHRVRANRIDPPALPEMIRAVQIAAKQIHGIGVFAIGQRRKRQVVLRGGITSRTDHWLYAHYKRLLLCLSQNGPRGGCQQRQQHDCQNSRARNSRGHRIASGLCSKGEMGAKFIIPGSRGGCEPAPAPGQMQDDCQPAPQRLRRFPDFPKQTQVGNAVGR